MVTTSPSVIFSRGDKCRPLQLYISILSSTMEVGMEKLVEQLEEMRERRAWILRSTETSTKEKNQLQAMLKGGANTRGSDVSRLSVTLQSWIDVELKNKDIAFILGLRVVLHNLNCNNCWILGVFKIAFMFGLLLVKITYIAFIHKLWKCK